RRRAVRRHHHRRFGRHLGCKREGAVMSLLAQHGALMRRSGGGGVPVELFVGATYAAGSQSGTTMTLSVPAGAAPGDTLIWIAVIRSDRTITVPSGWTEHQNQSFSTGSGPNQGMRFAALSKPYASESSVSVTHSSNAAWGGLLAV